MRVRQAQSSMLGLAVPGFLLLIRDKAGCRYSKNNAGWRGAILPILARIFELNRLLTE
jgi:hypothetical protein